MQAVVFTQPGAIHRKEALLDREIPKPVASGHDLLVRVKAVSVNPVDTKVRVNRKVPEGGYEVLGYDACGVVEAIGDQVAHFAPGDAVFYAGAINRPGTNSEFHLVDERLVGKKPNLLNDAESAALPLTAITAWEMLFHRLNVKQPPGEGGDTIVIIGGAGGVGSIAIQLLKALTNLTIIATASRPETIEWVKRCGAHYVLDHSKALAPQMAALNIGAPGLVFSTTQTDKHYADIAELIAPQGRFGLIDDPGDLSIMPFKLKSVSLHWELMFTRSLYSTADMAEQSQLLNKVSALVDEGKIQSTMTHDAGAINAANLIQAHTAIETGSTKGKIVLQGFGSV